MIKFIPLFFVRLTHIAVCGKFKLNKDNVKNGEIMRKVFKVISVILIISLLFSACNTDSGVKVVSKIEEYLSSGQYNECLQYVEELDFDVKKEITTDVCNLISSEYNSLVNENNINTSNLYHLKSYNKDFTEKCRKLWHIAKLFTISKDNENYTDFIYLHYFAEMCNFTKYAELYSLLMNVYESGYLDVIANAIKAYDLDGNSLEFDKAYKAALRFDYSAFDPQEYLIEDYRNAHDDSVKVLLSLSNGFATSNINVIATSMSNLKESLSDILYITDTLNAVHTKQKDIFNELSNGNISTTFKSNIIVSRREYSSNTTFPLENIFGEKINIEHTDDVLSDDNASEFAKTEALKIAVNAINKTKQYKNNLNVAYTQTLDIHMLSFSSDSNVTDAVNLTKVTLEQALNSANGTATKNFAFKNGISNNQTLYDFIPPSGKNAEINEDSVKDYSVVRGSGGYVISITLVAETSSKYAEAEGVNSLINGFLFENQDGVSDSKTTYSSAKVMLAVNNNGVLEKMEYSISGISDCEFSDENSEYEYDVQFSFDEQYSYVFEY